jgi:hypothetical protein
MANAWKGLADRYFPGQKNPPQIFNIVNEPRINSAESFSLGTLNRAFRSRGSPSEMRDTGRLAYLGGLLQRPPGS